MSLKKSLLLCAVAILPTSVFASDSDTDDDTDALLKAAIRLSLSQPQTLRALPQTPDHFGRWLDAQAALNPYGDPYEGYGAPIFLDFPFVTSDDDVLIPFEEQSFFVDALERSLDPRLHSAPSYGSSYACSSTDLRPTPRTSQKRGVHPTIAGPSDPKRPETSSSRAPNAPYNDPWQESSVFFKHRRHDRIVSPAPTSMSSTSSAAAFDPDAWPLAQKNEFFDPIITVDALQAILRELKLIDETEEPVSPQDDQGESLLD